MASIKHLLSNNLGYSSGDALLLKSAYILYKICEKHPDNRRQGETKFRTALFRLFRRKKGNKYASHNNQRRNSEANNANSPVHVIFASSTMSYNTCFCKKENANKTDKH